MGSAAPSRPCLPRSWGQGQSDSTPAVSAVQRMHAILEEERCAARQADLGRLEVLQEDKRATMALLQRQPGSRAEQESLAALAHDNVTLIRHLTQMLQGMVGLASGATYGANGVAGTTPDIKTDRGVR